MLQRIDARLQTSDGKLQQMQARVRRLGERAGDRRLEELTRSLLPAP